MYTKVIYDKSNKHLTSDDKRKILAVVNSGNNEYLNRFVKVNSKNILIEPESENKFKVTFKEFHKRGILGPYESIYNVNVELR